MANKKTNEEDGVWRTIGGRRVFIRNGQSLADAMKESGKFSNLNKNVSSHKHPSEVKKEEKKKDDYTKETDPEKRLKNVYMMDRVLRSMNNEEALDDGWLMNGVADGDTDNGWEAFKEDNYDGKNDYGFYVEDEAYNDMVKMYQSRVKEYAKDGVMNKEYFKNVEGNWKEQAGLTDEEIEFLKQDVEDFPIYTSLRDEVNSKDYKSKEEKKESISDLYEVYETEDGYKGKGKELLKFIEAEERDSGVEADENIKDRLRQNPDETFIFDNDENVLSTERQVKEGNPIEDLINKEGINAGGRLREVDSEAEEFFNQIKNANRTDEEAKTLLHFKYPNSNEDNLLDRYKQWSKTNDDYEYNLYKQSKEDPDSINPMTEWSTDWEELDKKYKDRYDKEFKASMGEVDIPEDFTAQFNDYAKKHDDLRLAKEKALQTKKDAENKWIEHYNNSNWNDENWRKEDDRLSQERDKSREEYDKAMKEYLAVANDNELSWEDKVARNDIQMEKELEEINAKRDSGDYRYNMDKWSDDYYGTFRKYERENAKLKAEGAKPEDEYVPLNSWGSFHNKMEELTKDNENAKWTGKEYTNDEFMEHLEDANWHTERRMLETAGLTNQEMKYIKDHTTLAAYSADLDRDKTQKLINEAKEKFRSNSNVPNKYEKGNAPFESKRVAENEIREKGYQYFSTHGVGPGTHPNDVKSRELDVELPGGWTTFKTDRPLTQQELDYYDIQPETRNSEFRKRFGLNEDNTKATTNDVMNNAIRSKVKKSSKKDYRTDGYNRYYKNQETAQKELNDFTNYLNEKYKDYDVDFKGRISEDGRGLEYYDANENFSYDDPIYEKIDKDIKEKFGKDAYNEPYDNVLMTIAGAYVDEPKTSKSTKTTNQSMNNAIRQSVSKKSTTSKSKSQRYSGTISYLKDMGLSQSQIDAVLDRFMKDNKK